MKLLISPKDLDEAKICIDADVEIIDVKNPKEGSLGANFPWVIREIRRLAKNRLVSATLGDCPYKPGTISLAALGCAFSGADYIKVGLYGIKSLDEGIDLMNNVVKAVKDYNSEIMVVVAGYADYSRIASIDPLNIVEVGKHSRCDVVMLDTAIKDGKNLFDHLTKKSCKKFVDKAKRYGLKTALAGSIRRDHIPILNEINPDIIGVRGAVCENGDRDKGKIRYEKIKELQKGITV